MFKLSRKFISFVVGTALIVTLTACQGESASGSALKSEMDTIDAFGKAGLAGTAVALNGTSLSEDPLTVHMIDVGQADSILLYDQKGHAMLIDGGDSNDADKIMKVLKDAKIEDLDLVIATHAHEDHIGSLDDVLGQYKTALVWMPADLTNRRVKDPDNTKSVTNLLAVISDQGLAYKTPNNGETYSFGAALVTVVHNGDSPSPKPFESLNNTSIVVRVDMGPDSFLFTADAEAEVERLILDRGSQIDVDVLKLGHHGSATSTTAQFLYETSPDQVLISVGANNDYGHPDPLVLTRLKAQKIAKVLRTDLNGDIVIQTPLSNNQGATPARATPEPPEMASAYTSLKITGLDKKGEVVTLQNQGSQSLSLEGCKIISVKGNQVFTFSEFTLKGKTSIRIGGYGAKVDFKWEDGKGVWSNSDQDDAKLVDPSGNQIDYFIGK